MADSTHCYVGTRIFCNIFQTTRETSTWGDFYLLRVVSVGVHLAAQVCATWLIYFNFTTEYITQRGKKNTKISEFSTSKILENLNRDSIIFCSKTNVCTDCCGNQMLLETTEITTEITLLLARKQKFLLFNELP